MVTVPVIVGVGVIDGVGVIVGVPMGDETVTEGVGVIVGVAVGGTVAVGGIVGGTRVGISAGVSLIGGSVGGTTGSVGGASVGTATTAGVLVGVGTSAEALSTNGLDSTLIKGVASRPASSAEGVGVPARSLDPPEPIHEPNSAELKPHSTTKAAKIAVDPFHSRSSARAGS